MECAAAVTCRWADTAATVPAAICSSTAAAAAICLSTVAAAAATASVAIIFGNSSSHYSLTVPFIMHRPNGGSEGHLIVVLTLIGGTRRNRHLRPTLRWAACTSASGAEDSGIWPRSVPLHSGSKVHATAVVSMATATTTASPTHVPQHTRVCQRH